MCAYLISNEASKVSGQVIAVDGNADKNGLILKIKIFRSNLVTNRIKN